MSADDHSREMDTPSRCEHCGSDQVIYDDERGEAVCQGCAVVLDLGAQKSDAIRLLKNKDLTPRKLLLEWYRKKRLAAAEHAQVDAKYSPELVQLESQMLRISGLACKRCGTGLVRQEAKGALPKYCKPCRKKAHLESVKRYRDENQERVKLTRRNYRAKIKKTGGQQGGKGRLGGKPVGRRSSTRLEITVMPVDLPMANANEA